MEIESVALVFLRDQLGLTASEQYPDIAADLLVAGYDSAVLRELAGYSRSDPLGARYLWIQTRQELDKPFEDEETARHILVRTWLGEIDGGALEPRTGVGLIYRQGWLELGRPTELDYFVGLMDDWDDMPQNRDNICDLIIAAARETLAFW